jgi:hypothetical protein
MTNITIEDVGQAMREVIEEMEQEDEGRDVSMFNLSCLYCRLPIDTGQSFVLHHSKCFDKVQSLR